MGKELDTHAVTELVLFIENDYETYSRWLVPMFRNYERKVNAGKFHRPLAVQGLGRNTCAAAARKYHAEFGGAGRWHSVFPMAVRLAAAEELLQGFESELAAGNSWLGVQA